MIVYVDVPQDMRFRAGEAVDLLRFAKSGEIGPRVDPFARVVDELRAVNAGRAAGELDDAALIERIATLAGELGPA